MERASGAGLSDLETEDCVGRRSGWRSCGIELGSVQLGTIRSHGRVAMQVAKGWYSPTLDQEGPLVVQAMALKDQWSRRGSNVSVGMGGGGVRCWLRV